MKIKDVVRKLELRLVLLDKEVMANEDCARGLLEYLQKQDSDALNRWSGDCTQTGEHCPIDQDGNIIFGKKKFFSEGEPFPDDEYTWIPIH